MQMKPVLFSKPSLILQRPIYPYASRSRRVRALSSFYSVETQETIRLVGKSITLFVGFYAGLQWLYYRELRKEVEDKTKPEEKENDDSTNI